MKLVNKERDSVIIECSLDDFYVLCVAIGEVSKSVSEREALSRLGVKVAEFRRLHDEGCLILETLEEERQKLGAVNFQRFVGWAQDKRTELYERGLTVSLRGPSGQYKPDSIGLSIHSDRYIGQINVWDDGSSHAEILEVSSERQVLSKHSEFGKDADFDHEFDEFLRYYD